MPSDKNKTSLQYYSETVAEKASVANELLGNVLNNAKEILQPDRYTKYLDTIERFHWYSYVNNLLILSQHPDARYLAGYDFWKRSSLAAFNDPNRRILRASGVGKGIKLVAPFTVVSGDSRSLINFVVPVYDINQVNDIPVQDNDFVDLKRCSYVDIINAINFVAPYRMAFASNEDKNLSCNVKGYCNHSQKLFIVDSRLPAKGLLSALLHEFTAAELYLCGYKNDELQGLVVESVYYILLKHFRLNTDSITFSYVSRFNSSENADIAEAFLSIQTIAHSIIDSIEEHLEYIIDLMPTFEEESYQMTIDDLDYM